MQTQEQVNFYEKQYRIALRNCGSINPENITEYIAQKGYEALAVCDVLYEINQYGSTRSMNASAAGAIAMYHWALQHLPR